MNKEVEQFSAKNLNPMLSVAKDNTVLYSNKAGEPLLHEWRVEVGQKLPSSIGDIVQTVIRWNSPEKKEVKVGNKVYLVVFNPLPGQECVNISGFDISDQKELEEKLLESERRLYEAQRLTHVGNWDWNIVANKIYRSDEMYHILGLDSYFDTKYGVFLKYLHPKDRVNLDNALIDALNGKPFDNNYRIILSDGEERIVHIIGEVIFDEKNSPVRVRGIVQDITELKKSEEKIQKLAAIVESSGDAIGTISLDGIITSWNNGAEQVYGYSAEEILGKDVSTLAPSNLNKETKKLIKKIKQGEEVHNYETLRLRKDGMTINTSITLSPVYDSYGKLTAVSFISRDITKNKKAEERLRESEEKYRNIVETANEGISINNGEGILTFVNQRMADMTGYNIDEIIGRNIRDFVGKEDQSTFLMKLEKGRRGFNESYDVKLTRKDGSPIWVYINSKPFLNSNGRFMGSLNMHTDITERKLLEEQTRRRAEEMTKLLDVAPVAIFIGHDPQNYNITGNRAANELLETEVGENISASTTSVRRFFSRGQELTADELPMQKASLKDIDVLNVELDMLLPSGECRSLMGSASPLHDVDGQVRGSVGTFMDITERKQAEETLRNYEIARKKEIHHRIKNNLQVISSLLDLQADLFKGRKTITDVEVLKAFQESMDRVLSIALIHEELYKGNNIDVLDFSQYIKELAENLQLTYRLETNVNLNFDLEENFLFDMETAIPLGIIINELVSNSFKYAFPDREKGEIQIKLHREGNGEYRIEDSKSTSFTLSISDNGIGIPEDLDIEDMDSLGLQLVTSLVDQLDGELELKRDNGTEFTIRFTVKEKDKQASSLTSQQLIEE
jgi:PAS domain S-box-containing protein